MEREIIITREENDDKIDVYNAVREIMFCSIKHVLKLSKEQPEQFLERAPAVMDMIYKYIALI